MADSAATPLRIGFVPEHFSTPLHFALTLYPPALPSGDVVSPAPVAIPYPSGTGAMAAALRAGAIDVAVGLTEGWIAALGKVKPRRRGEGAAAAAGSDGANNDDDGGFRLVGTYVTTPLRWAVSVGAPSATEAAGYTRATPAPASVAELRGSKVGVSRIGSGSYVMAYVLAQQQGWLDDEEGAGAGGGEDKKQRAAPPFGDFVVLHDFARLRAAVNSGEADFFMWEHFTTAGYHARGEVARVGDILTPWSSWLIVAATSLLGGGGGGGGGHDGAPAADPRLSALMRSLDRGVAHFVAHQEDAVAYISSALDYSEADARAWLDTVEFASPRTEGVDLDLVRGCVDVLRKAGVLEGEEAGGMTPEEMVAVVS